MRIWFDTEFIEDGRTIDLLSIGMVREDGAMLYLENVEAELSKAGDWVQNNVISQLDWSRHGYTRAEITKAIVFFVGGHKPEFWAYYGAYDWVALCQLFGPMIDLPKGWPMYVRDLKQYADLCGNPRLPEQTTKKHHALNDALWTRVAFNWLDQTVAVGDITRPV